MSKNDDVGETSFYDTIGGMPTIKKIVDRFYEGIATDDLIRPMYKDEDLADGSAAERLALFMAQYWGGPTTYSDQRGHPRLRMRHAEFAVTEEAAERWIQHFRSGLDAANLPPEQHAEFAEYIERAARFLVNS